LTGSATDDKRPYTRPATWDDVVRVARLLNDAGARYVLVGGYALAAHGFVRMTQDVDIAVAPDAENARRWVAALSQLPDGAARELSGEADPFAGGQAYAIRINDEFTVDVLPSAGGVPFSALEPHIVALTVQGETLRILDLEGLLMTKQGLRPQDQADAALIRRALGRPDSDE
jgi:ABC-type glycerol-3-phosphate transport system substrate-binding protein